MSTSPLHGSASLYEENNLHAEVKMAQARQVARSEVLQQTIRVRYRHAAYAAKNLAVVPLFCEERAHVLPDCADTVFCAHKLPLDVRVTRSADGADACVVQLDMYDTWQGLFRPYERRREVILFSENGKPLKTLDSSGTYALNAAVHGVALQWQPHICAAVVHKDDVAAYKQSAGMAYFARRIADTQHYSVLPFRRVAGFQCATCGYTTHLMANYMEHVHDDAETSAYGELVFGHGTTWAINRNFEYPRVRKSRSATHANWHMTQAQLDAAFEKNWYKSRQQGRM